MYVEIENLATISQLSFIPHLIDANALDLHSNAIIPVEPLTESPWHLSDPN